LQPAEQDGSAALAPGGGNGHRLPEKMAPPDPRALPTEPSRIAYFAAENAGLGHRCEKLSPH
jgi:hypothetical protein